MFGRPSIHHQPLKNLAGIAAEGYQDLVNCYFQLNENGDGVSDTKVVKALGFAQSGTNTSLPAAKRGLAITGFTPSTGSAGGVYAVWDKSSGTESEVYKLGAADPTAQGVSAYLPTQNTDGEFEQVNDDLYYTNGVDAAIKLTGSTGVWSQMAGGEPLSDAGTVAKYLAWHNFMLFAARTVNAPNKLNVSNAGTPETFGSNTKTFRHAIIGMKSLGDYLMIYTTKEIWSVTGTVPSQLGFRQLLHAHPCVSHRSIVQMTGDNGALEHWYLGADYVWATNGSSFRILGEESWNNYQPNLSTAQLALAAAVYNEDTGQYELSVPTGAATANTVTWAYDPLADKWVEKPLKTASCWAKHGSPTPSTYFLDSNATGKAYLNNSGQGIQSLKTTLTGDHTAAVTTLTVGATAGFPSSGVVQIENEAISYTGVSATEFTGCIRGYQGTTAATHAGTTAVYPAHQFRYRTTYQDFSVPNMIKKFQVLWVNTDVSTIAYSLSVNVNIDQQGYSLAKNIPLATSGMVWGTDLWGTGIWGSPSILLTPTNRTAISGRGKTIKLSFDESTSIQQTEITEAELRFRPLKRK